MDELSPEAVAKLEKSQNIWFASVRPDGRPHLTPVWFAYHAGKLYVSLDPNSIKMHNITHNPRVVVALEEGDHPVICEGIAQPFARPYPAGPLEEFQRKYQWDISTDEQYNQLVEVAPTKWLVW